jgi:hypothetical protein
VTGYKQASQNKNSVNNKLFVYSDNMEPRWSSWKIRTAKKVLAEKKITEPRDMLLIQFLQGLHWNY